MRSSDTHGPMPGSSVRVLRASAVGMAEILSSVSSPVRVSFWGLNGGLLLMVITNLFPAGVLQLRDVLAHGYWHARGPAFAHEPLAHALEWLRLPADFVFIAAGVGPAVVAAAMTYASMRRSAAA